MPSTRRRGLFLGGITPLSTPSHTFTQPAISTASARSVQIAGFSKLPPSSPNTTLPHQCYRSIIPDHFPHTVTAALVSEPSAKSVTITNHLP